MSLFFIVLCVLFYFGATALVSTRWFHQEGPMHKNARWLAVAALLLHAVVLHQSILDNGGQNLSILNVASLSAWLITLVITVNALTKAQSFLLPLVTGFSGTIVLLAAVIPDANIVYIELRPWLLVHISLALLAYGSLCIALLYALQLAFINNQLKHKSSLILQSSLPPLMQVEKNLFKLLIIGTVLLSLSLVSGFLFLEDMFVQRQVHKTILTIVALAVYVGLLVAHHRVGLKEHTVILLTILGCALLTLAYFGSRVVKEVFLG